ncbi:MAG: NAD(P)H-binding protein, partial [Bacteroidales bacterium]
MKNVLLIGGSGFVGSAILKELLDRGYKVTTLVRNPDKITIKSSDLTIVKGDVSDFDEIKKLATGKDAVISAYNPGWNNPNIYEETLKNYPRILDAVKAAGVKRILIVGGAGTLFVAPGVRVMDTGVIPEAIMGGVKSLGEFYL